MLVSQVCSFFIAGGRYIQEVYGLRIQNITREDDGQYTCRAEVPNDGRFDKRDVDVIVHSEHPLHCLLLPLLEYF